MISTNTEDINDRKISIVDVFGLHYANNMFINYYERFSGLKKKYKYVITNYNIYDDDEQRDFRFDNIAKLLYDKLRT